MGLEYLPTFTPSFTIKKTTIHVGKYTSPMDPMGNRGSIYIYAYGWDYSEHNKYIYIIYISIHNHAKPVRNLVVTVTPGGGEGRTRIVYT